MLLEELLTAHCDCLIAHHIMSLVRQPTFDINEPRHEKNGFFAYAKTKAQISAFVFATQIVQSLYLLNPQFQASSYLMLLHSPVCVGSGRKPRGLVFSRRGSNGSQINTGAWNHAHAIYIFFTAVKMKQILIKNLSFSYFCSKHRLWIHVRTASLRRF